ncbi:DUF4188 domain-containing protein [Salinicoccus carnicancri]|uniref:DUF4188 domain-containing protein n=1 Tax=Salinicoccus carnicancri TaxID=558170 RepID=UPI0002EB3E58|nr:DUF4188 domain-containing protein [Salinicoccus carnicancri]
MGVYKGRHTADQNEEVTVFLIGMNINNWLAVHKWLPVVLAMPPMIAELERNKDLGYLSGELFFGLGRTLALQYWKSTDDLFDYARMQNHLKAWRKFNKRVRGNSAVGFYHETYRIPANSSEMIYVNMPAFGLGKAFGNEPVARGTESARERLSRKTRTSDGKE